MGSINFDVPSEWRTHFLEACQFDGHKPEATAFFDLLREGCGWEPRYPAALRAWAIERRVCLWDHHAFVVLGTGFTGDGQRQRLAQAWRVLRQSALDVAEGREAPSCYGELVYADDPPPPWWLSPGVTWGQLQSAADPFGQRPPSTFDQVNPAPPPAASPQAAPAAPVPSRPGIYGGR